MADPKLCADCGKELTEEVPYKHTIKTGDHLWFLKITAVTYITKLPVKLCLGCLADSLLDATVLIRKGLRTH